MLFDRVDGAVFQVVSLHSLAYLNLTGLYQLAVLNTGNQSLTRDLYISGSFLTICLSKPPPWLCCVLVSWMSKVVCGGRQVVGKLGRY